MNTVYKKNGNKLEVNDHALNYLAELGLSKDAPVSKPSFKKPTPKKAKKA